LDYFESLTNVLDQKDVQYHISGNNLKLKFKTTIKEEEVELQIQIL